MASGEEKALRPAGDVAFQVSVPRAAPLHAAGAAFVYTSASGGGVAVGTETVAEEDDDEQVERFYALLANIRALRGMHRAAAAGAGACSSSHRGGSGPGSRRGTKRARGASEPPWRPAFRIEDFQEAAASEEERAGKRARRGGVERPPSRKETDAGEEEEEDEAVDARGGRESGPRVAARG